MLPDWAPNIHPLIIHFPIVLIPLAFAVHLISILLKQLDRWAIPVGVIYLCSFISVLAAFLSGRQAVDSVSVIPQANLVLSEHADLALWTLSISVVATIMYWLWFRIRNRTELHWSALVIILISSGLMVVTADHGGQLVYRFGTGVSINQSVIDNKYTEKQPAGLIKNEDGSWMWIPGSHGPKYDFPELQFHAGNAELFNLEAGEIGHYSVKDFILFTLGDRVGDVQVEVNLDLTHFKGSATIVHHYTNMDQFDFLEIENDRMILGRISEGGKVVADENEVKTDGWFTMRVVGSGGHFRGYIDEKLITHGHSPVLEPGYVGLRIHGEGIIGIKSIKVIPLKDNQG